MRNGKRIYDTDTHGGPCTELLDPYLGPAIRELVPDLENYKSPIKTGWAGEVREAPYKHFYGFGRNAGWGKGQVRVLGQAGPAEGAERHWQKFMGAKFPSEDGQWEATARLKDMDEEGTDVQLIVPGGADHPDAKVEMELIKAEHRYLDDWCGVAPDRLKSMLVVPARSVEESVAEIKRYGNKRWVVGVRPHLPLDFPIDHPDMEPIWKAADDAGLTVVHHSFSWGYPGYRDLWENPFLGRTASHPWAAMRAMAAFICSGTMDRYPNIKMAILESGFGWLPFWARRMDDQVDYVGYVAEMKHKPSEYIASGRFFCSIVIHEGAAMVEEVNHLMGDGILMFGSDYPHSESRFPGSVDEVLGWKSLSDETLNKLFWENPVRAFGEP